MDAPNAVVEPGGSGHLHDIRGVEVGNWCSLVVELNQVLCTNASEEKAEIVQRLSKINAERPSV